MTHHPSPAWTLMTCRRELVVRMKAGVVKFGLTGCFKPLTLDRRHPRCGRWLAEPSRTCSTTSGWRFLFLKSRGQGAGGPGPGQPAQHAVDGPDFDAGDICSDLLT
jgi:hypothetical protein